jgi:hypothetical protein
MPSLSNKNNQKTAKAFLLVGVVFLLALLAGVLLILQKKPQKKPETVEKVKPPIQSETLPETSLPTHKVDFINGEKINQREYDEAFAYDQNVWKADPQSKQTQKIIYQRIFERTLLRQEAAKQGWTTTEEEKRKAEKELFGENIHPNLKLYPEFDRQIEAAVIKKKIRRELVSWRSGGYLRVRFVGVGPNQLADQGKNPREMARQKIDSAKQRLNQGESFASLVEEFNNDPEVKALNDGESSRFFEFLTRETTIFDDPIFNKTIFNTPVGKISEQFILKTLNTPKDQEPTEYAFCLVIVTAKNDSPYSTYNHWLAETLKQANFQ